MKVDLASVVVPDGNGDGGFITQHGVTVGA